ncbi:MAG: hypothetical protein ACXVDD_08210, partial [Polyangia bacterium]
MWSIRPLLAAALVTVGACSAGSAGTAPQRTVPVAAAAAAPARPRGDPDPGWPRAMVDGSGWRVTAHQPQVERLDGDQLRARVAVVVVGPRSAPSYGVIGMRARAAIDKRSRLVTLDDVAVERAQWAEPPRDEELEAAVKRDLPPLVATIALDRLVVELAAERARFGDRAPRLRNDPPRIFVSTQLAVLVPIDGDAVWRKASERFDRLVNTRALILFDRARRWLYLYVGDTWYR